MAPTEGPWKRLGIGAMSLSVVLAIAAFWGWTRPDGPIAVSRHIITLPDQERMNEIRLYQVDDAEGRRGHRTILSGPEHEDYANFCPAPGHGLGINDLKTIEVRNFLNSISTDTAIHCDFQNGWRVQAIVDAIEHSHLNHEWVDVSEGQN